MNNNLFKRMKDIFLNHYFSILVSMLVIFAFLLRYLQTKYGLPYIYNWDEPQIASTALNMMKTGDYNPHFFNYGSLMIYANFFVDILHYLVLMGKPDTAESYLTSLSDIKTNADTGWHWTISHPSFYHWNRMLSALLGVGTVFVTYLIGRIIFNKWIGLIAGIYIATLTVHISQSASRITTDAPVAFFIVTTVLFSILFIRDKKLSYLITSLIFSGIAIATKYNAALSMLMPLLALVWVYIQSKESVKPYMWLLVPIVPTIVFFIIMPYAIIDLTDFLKGVGAEVRHYKIRGHGSATSIPGWEHFSFQLHNFYVNVGLESAILIALGGLGLLFKPLFVLTLLLPVLYIYYMTGMTVNFHRNFVQIYPFIALLFASGIYYLYMILEMIRSRFYPKTAWISMVIVVFILSFCLIPQGVSSFNIGIARYHAKDTRTRVIDEINNLKGFQNIIIAKELRIHKQDLRNIELPYTINPLLSIDNKRTNRSVLYVLPSSISSFKQSKRLKNKIEPMNNLISKIDKSFIVKKIGGNNHTRIDIYSINPGILLAKELPLIPIQTDLDEPLNIDLDLLTYSAQYDGKPLRMIRNGTVLTPVYSLRKDNYKVVVNAKGSKARNEYAKLKVEVFKYIGNSYIPMDKIIIETDQMFTDYIVPFELIEDANVSFKVSFINDIYLPKVNEDRNAYLKSITLKKMNK